MMTTGTAMFWPMYLTMVRMQLIKPQDYFDLRIDTAEEFTRKYYDQCAK